MANMDAATYYSDLLKKRQGVEQYPSGVMGGGLSVSMPTSPTVASAPQAGAGETDYIRQLYDAQMQSKIASLSAARDASLSALDQQQKAIAPQYYDARNSVAAQAGKERLALNEQAAQTGLGSGATAYMQSLGKTSMQNNLGALQRDEAKSVADIEAQKAAARQQFESAMVQAKLDGDAQRYSALLDAYVRNETQAREDARYAESLAMDKDNIAYSREQDALNQKLAQAKYMAQYGVFDGFKALGYSDSQIAQMKQQYAVEQLLKQQQYPTEPTALSIADARLEARRGNWNDEVVKAFYLNGYTDEKIAKEYSSYADYLAGLGGGNGGNGGGGNGGNGGGGNGGNGGGGNGGNGGGGNGGNGGGGKLTQEQILAAIYEAMVKSGDMGQWLNENDAYLTPEEQLYAASILRSGR